MNHIRSSSTASRGEKAYKQALSELAFAHTRAAPLPVPRPHSTNGMCPYSCRPGSGHLASAACQAFRERVSHYDSYLDPHTSTNGCRRERNPSSPQTHDILHVYPRGPDKQMHSRVDLAANPAVRSGKDPSAENPAQGLSGEVACPGPGCALQCPKVRMRFRLDSVEGLQEGCK